MNILGLLALLVLAFMGIPLYLAIFIAATIILVVGVGIDPTMPIAVMFGRLTHLQLIAVPLFILLGSILSAGGAGRPLIRLVNAFLGHLPGGPAYAIIIANMLLAAMCASPMAGIAAFGPIMVPMLKDLGYSERFAIGLVISSAMLEPIIPPSILPIIYAYIAGGLFDEPVSVMTLWTASIIPGLILAGLLACTVYYHSRKGHFQRMASVSWKERWQALKEGWPILIMPGVVLGPLYGGYTTPTESAAVGLLYSFLICTVFYRGLNLKNFWGACAATVRVLGMVFCIVMGALLLTIALTYSRIPFDLSEWLTGLGLTWWLFISLNLILFIILGMFLDPAAIILISVPLLGPTIVNEMGYSAITYGIFACLSVNLANLTPPYGILLFATSGILNKPYHYIVKACMMFFPALILGLILIAYLSGLSTWLPTVTGR